MIRNKFLLSGLLLSLMTPAMADNLYGLRDNIQEGVILHCFDWTAAQVEAEITNIARAGFSAVQLSPVHEREGASPWYMAYQPYDFKVGNSIANVSSLTSLCNAAHEVGVKVIVDVIANHTNGDLKWVAPRLQDHSLYHNDATKIIDIDYSNRWSITHDDMGIQDLDTSNKTVQGYLKDYIAELKSCGVDGIRFDAAKHIGLPSEGDDFWQNVPDAEMYNYGEILDSTGGDDPMLFAEYQKYISITDNKYGNGLADSFSSGYVPSSIGVFNQNGANTAKLVYWGESHDTYSNENGESKYKSQNAIDRAYAIAAGNNGATALYFSRPFETEKDKIMLGVKGSTHFTAPEVAEVNHCHNLCAGEPNYYVHTSTVGAQVRKSGCIMATGNGNAQQVSFDNGDGKGGWLTPGLYTDKVAGGQFTVTAATISGYVGNTGIAVIYEGEPAPPVEPYTPSVTASEVSCFIETDAQQVSIWAWDDTDNYTGGAWSTKPQMQLMGVNAQGRNIFKWTYTGSLTTQPEHVIFVTDGSQSADLDFTNHGYYIGGVIDHVVQPDEQPDVPQPTFSLTVGDATVLQGQNATLQLCLTTQLLSVTGLQCLITLPDGVTLTDADVATDRCPGHTVMTTATRTGYALTLLDKTNAMLVGDEGAIVTLSVDVSRTAALGKAALKISDVMVTSVNANSEVTTYRQDDATYATLMIADPLVHADINADGRITVADVTTLIDTMQLGTAATAEQIDRADVNADGQLSEADLVLLIQLLLAQ